jgi:mono/diheme cytochrome c family protein
VGPLTPFATFVGVRAVNGPAGTNIVQIVLYGQRRTTPGGAASMPAFGAAYSGAEIAAVASYVMQRFGTGSSNVPAAYIAKARSGS